MNGIDSLTREDLIKILERDRQVKDQLAGRLAAVVAENVELVVIIQELQSQAQPIEVDVDVEK